MSKNIYKDTLRCDFGESWSIDPWDARFVVIIDEDGLKRKCPINQDTIDEIIEYFQAARDSMND